MQVARLLGQAWTSNPATGLTPAQQCQKADPVVAAVAFFHYSSLSGLLANSDTGTLGRVICQQLEQSGFLAALPEMMLAAAQALDHLQEPRQLATALQDPLYSQNRSNTGSAALRALHQYAGRLMHLTDVFMQYYAREVFKDTVRPLLYPAGLQLTFAAMQHANLCLDQLPAQHSIDTEPLATLVTSAHRMASEAFMWFHRMQSKKGNAEQRNSCCTRVPTQQLPMRMPDADAQCSGNPPQAAGRASAGSHRCF